MKDKFLVKAEWFKIKTVKVNSQEEPYKINIVMAGSESEIDMAVAKGYISEKNLTDAKKRYNTEKPYAYGFNNMEEPIRSKLPILTISGDEIIIRGSNSINGNNGALVVLNGTTYNWGAVKNLEVRTVKNIKALSGTAANRYGSGSGNGVILIELISE